MNNSKRTTLRVLAFFCCIAVAFSFMLPYDTAYAATTLGDQPETFKAEELTGDLMGQEVPLAKKYQDMIDYYMIKDGPVYKGSGQCWGYAEMMRKRFGSGGGKTVSLNKKATKKSVYNALKDVKPGTHLSLQIKSQVLFNEH